MATLASFPGPREGGESGCFFTVCACTYSFGGIPLASWMFYLCLYTHDVKTNAKLYIVHKVTIVSENIVMRGLDHMLSPMPSSG